MDRASKIYKLKDLISDYEDEVKELSEMCDRWNDYDDPGSDPGLQYEQEGIVDSKYQELVKFANSLN